MIFWRSCEAYQSPSSTLVLIRTLFWPTLAGALAVPGFRWKRQRSRRRCGKRSSRTSRQWSWRITWRARTGTWKKRRDTWLECKKQEAWNHALLHVVASDQFSSGCWRRGGGVGVREGRAPLSAWRGVYSACEVKCIVAFRPRFGVGSSTRCEQCRSLRCTSTGVCCFVFIAWSRLIPFLRSVPVCGVG